MVTLTRASRSISADLAAALTQARVELTVAPGALRDTLRAAIAHLGGYCDWRVDHTGWVVTLYVPEERTFSGGTLEDGLASCLAWLVTPERRDVLALV